MANHHFLRRLALTGAALLSVTATLPQQSARADPGYTDRPSHGRLSATIRYTEYGIPHILAKDYPNLGFGVGWAQATDQVCELANGFVTVQGERSRHFGADGQRDEAMSAASTNLASDLYFRGVRDEGSVEKLLAQPAPAGLSRQAKDLMRGWAAGYNAWLRQNRITDPACRGADWVRPVTELDVARRAYALAVLGGQGRVVDGITAAQPPGASAQAARTAGADDQARAAREFLSADNTDRGSNAVAFSGSTTANGRGLLLGNPHYPWHGGRRFWQSQTTIPGELNVAGGTLLGFPVIQVGHNARVAWSLTVATGVSFSLYELKLAPSDPTSYLVDGKAEQMTRRTVTVPVRGEDGRMTEVKSTQWWTRYGPVITSLGTLALPWTSSSAYAFNDPNAANLRMVDTVLGYGKARSVDELLDAVDRTQGMPWVNTIAADAEGHSVFTQSQVVPRITDDVTGRCSTPLGQQIYPATGLAVLDGSRGECDLGKDPGAVQPGIFGPSAMPTLKNAPYAVNSNNSAWLANLDRPITGYPRVFGDVNTPRSLRTRGGVADVKAMAERGGLTVDDLLKQQFANRVTAGDLAADDAARACSELPGGTATGSDGKAVEVSQACQVLAGWDRTANTDSKGALLFDRFWRRMIVAVPAAQLWRVPFSKDDPARTPNTLNTGLPAFAQSLADAVGELRASGIALDALLGDHQVVVRNGKRIPVPGGTESLGVWNKTEPVWDDRSGGYTEVAMGTSYLQAVGFDGSRCPVARTLLSFSQSPNPNSPHYSDQTELFSAERTLRGRFCEKDILTSPGLRVEYVYER
ncbi:penicillin acylase family protein [Nonomuraea sp. NPDC050556]|uniref:penicillin acylase family protein n=1 Tax=Nonomuraea sp. NPDC050556 TaxID=3364369 RepID=UPI003787B045